MQNGATSFQHSTYLNNAINISALCVEGIGFIKCLQHTFNNLQQNEPSTPFNSLNNNISISYKGVVC